MSKRIAYLTAAAFSALAITATVVAPARAEEKTVMVGGAAMFPSKNIVQNAVNSKDRMESFSTAATGWRLAVWGSC